MNQPTERKPQRNGSKVAMLLCIVAGSVILAGCEDPKVQEYERQRIRDESYTQGKRDGTDVGVELGKSTGIDIGKAIGFTNGFNVGVEVGKSSGMELGKSIGFTNGYNAGVVFGREQAKREVMAALKSVSLIVAAGFVAAGFIIVCVFILMKRRGMRMMPSRGSVLTFSPETHVNRLLSHRNGSPSRETR